jgi:hypothetical protein
MSMYDPPYHEDLTHLWKKRDDLKRKLIAQIFSGLVVGQKHEYLVNERCQQEMLDEASSVSEFLIKTLYSEEFNRLVVKESD